MNPYMHLPFLWLSLATLVLVGLVVFLLIKAFSRMTRHPRKSRRAPPSLLMEALQDQTRHARRTRDRLDRSERALAELQQMHTRVTESLPIGLLVVDPSMGVDFCNPAAQRLLGQHPRHLESLGPELMDKIRTMSQGPLPASGNLDLTIGDAPIHAELTASPLSDLQIIVTIQDRTKLIQLERTLQAHRELTFMGEMASGIAHEVKNVLAILKGYAQMLCSDPGNVSFAQRMQEEIDGLLKVIYRFRNTSRLESANMEPIELRPWFDQLQSQWSSRGHAQDIAFHVPCDDHETWWGDRVMLDVMLENLIRNALEASENGQDRLPRVHVRAHRQEHQLQLSVEDTGPGFSSNVKSRLFVPFVSSKTDGMGLGLFQCRKIAMAHGGQLEVKEQPTRIICTLPRLS